jgi:hypothetical protein
MACGQAYAEHSDAELRSGCRRAPVDAPVEMVADEQCGHPCPDYFAYGFCHCTTLVPEPAVAF